MGIVRKIDYVGRLTLPKELRRRAGMLEENAPVEIEVAEDGVIILKRVEVEVKELFECDIEGSNSFYKYSTRRDLIDSCKDDYYHFDNESLKDFLGGVCNSIFDKTGECYIQLIAIDKVTTAKDRLNDIINEYNQDH